MKTLKMKTVKSLLWIVILMWALAGLSAYFAIPSFMTFLEEPTPLEQVDFSKDVEGLYVSGTIYGIYGSYCTETEDGKTTKKEYLIDADDYYYMGLLAEGKDMEAANKLAEATQEFLNSEQDYSLITPYQYEVKGVITAMPSDSLDFYHESIDWYSLDDQSKDLYLPYYLKVNSFGRYNASQLTMMVMVIALLFLVGLIFLILILSGRYQKYVKRYIKNSTNPELARQKIDSFVKNTEEVNKLRHN